MVMSGVPASDGRCTPARPASHVWNASVDVRRRTRRNAYTIRGAAPELNHRTSCRGSRGSASLPSPNLIVKPRGLFAETLSIRARSGPNPRLTYSTNRYLGQRCKKSLKDLFADSDWLQLRFAPDKKWLDACINLRRHRSDHDYVGILIACAQDMAGPVQKRE